MCVCASVLTHGPARDIKAKEEESSASSLYMCCYMGVPCSACENGRVRMSDEVAVVKGDRAGLCK